MLLITYWHPDAVANMPTREFPFARYTLLAAGVAGALGVLIGAFGAHLLPGFLAGQGLDEALIRKRQSQFDVGARYHLIHAVALLALAAVRCGPLSLRRWAAWLLVAGMVFFSGSLYLLVLTNTTWLGAITPVGGLAWIVAWTLLTVAAARTNTFQG